MARNKSVKCGCKTRIVSDAVKNYKCGACFDVCQNPQCDTPVNLGIYAPLIYDEIGVNLCTTVNLGVDVFTEYPTASNAWAQLIDLTYTYGEGNVQVESIAGRPNCYAVTLSNLSAVLAVVLYDDACKALGTVYTTVQYLPSDTTAASYDETTNPASIELDIFAPYGVSYNTADEGYSIALNNIGFFSADNYVRQGINLYGLPKILNFDEEESTITVGLTLILQSLYFDGYKVANAGKIRTPKGSISTPEDTACQTFVEGELLDLEIRPLQIGPPLNEENLKNDCGSSGCKDGCECATANQ